MDLKRLKLKPHKLFHHLEEVAKWKVGECFAPVFVEISPTDMCNQKCPFCYTEYLGHEKLTIPEDLLVKIFKDMGRAGVKSVLVQGTGEPLLNKALPNAIVAGKEAGLDIALCTNGVLLSNDVLETILPCISLLRVSAVESTPEIYAKTHGCPESHWHEVSKGLERAVIIRERDNLNVLIAATFMPFNHNVSTVVDVVGMSKDVGIDYIVIKPPQHSGHNIDHNWGRGIHAGYRDLFIEAANMQTDEFKVSMRWDMIELEQEKAPFLKEYDRCYGVEFAIMIDANARIYPCLQYWRDDRFCLGNLSLHSFDEIWKSEDRKNVLNNFYEKADLNECRCQCKQHHINMSLWELANPPMHINFL